MNYTKIFLLLFFISFWCNSFSQTTTNPIPAIKDSVTDNLKSVLSTANLNLVSTLRASVKDKLSDTLKFIRESILNPLQNIYRNPVKFNDGDISYSGARDSSYIRSGTSSYFNNAEINSSWTIAMIPVTVMTRNQSLSDIEDNSNLPDFSIQFDRVNYLSQLKKKLAGKFDPSGLAGINKNPLEKILIQARQSLAAEIKSLNNSYHGLLSNEIQSLGDLQSLFSTDIKTLKEKFLNADISKNKKEKENLLTAMQQRLNNGQSINKDEFNAAQNEVLKTKALQELLKKIEQHKARWEQSGLIKKIREADLSTLNGVKQLLNDPSSITKMARQHLSLSGLQRFFLNIKQLNIGQNNLSLTPLSLQHFLSKGINTEFLMGKRSILLSAGRQSDFNSILDYPFTNTIFSNNGQARAIRLGLGSGTGPATNISISSFAQSMSGSINNPLMQTPLRQVLVTTVSDQFTVGQKGSVDVELSRSATQYNHTTGDSLQKNNNLSRIFSTENLMDNTAISFKYSDEYTAQGLTYQVNFSKTSNGYTNPGNSYLSTGSTQAGLNVRKSFLKNKIIISSRVNERSYKYNDNIDSRWRNSSMLFDAKWKMKKGQYLSLRYQPVKMFRIDGKIKTPVSSLERISAEANLYRRFRKISYRNYITLSGQSNKYLLGPNTMINNSSLSITSFQNILIGKRSLYINTNYNHTDNSSQYAFLNSSFYTETGCSYQLFKYITASSGLVYNSAESWYQQAGLRQTLSGQLNEKLSLNIYIDARKNLKVIQPLWNDPVRMDINLRYRFKNQD